ncbi:hypothetical protein [Flavobacterium columnare]|nr:hypothetical protein [Flavobacterium columnare]
MYTLSLGFTQSKPDVAENLIGGAYNNINLENNKLHEHVIWIE